MERNGLVAFKLHHGTVLERSEQLFLASGNGYINVFPACHLCVCQGS